MEDTIRLLRKAYVDLAQGSAVCRPRLDVRIPAGDGSKVYQWGTMEGGSVESGYFAIRMKSDIVEETEYGGTRTQEKYCLNPGTYCGLIMLMSVRTGEPLALINDGVLQHMRVSGDSAIGSEVMARKDSKTIGMIGSGGMARGHIDALLKVFSIDRVKVYSPTRRNREQFAREMSDLHKIEVLALSSPDEVCGDVDIVCGCTDSVEPVIRADWISPGTHITCVGGRLDEELIDKIDIWLRLGNASVPVGEGNSGTTSEWIGYEACPGDPLWTQHQAKKIRSNIVRRRDTAVLWVDILSGVHPGRDDSNLITFSERGNIQGVQFYGLAGRVYELARDRGLGKTIPTDWLLQDIRD